MSSREAQTQKDACDQHKKRVKKLLIKIQDCNDADRRRQLLRDCKVEMQRFKSSISNFQDELEPIRDANVRNEFSEQLKDLTKTYKKCLKKYDGLNDTPRQELLSGGRRT